MYKLAILAAISALCAVATAVGYYDNGLGHGGYSLYNGGATYGIGSYGGHGTHGHGGYRGFPHGYYGHGYGYAGLGGFGGGFLG